MNLLEKQSDECLLISIDDVRDSLGGNFSSMSDTEIDILIIKSQNSIIKYINSINPNTSCNPCDYIECEHIVSLKRAIVLNIKNEYSQSESNSLPALKSETTACGVKLEYVVSNDNSSNSDIYDLLGCFNMSSSNRSVCGTQCYSDGCPEMFK